MDNNKTNKPTGSGASSAPASDKFFDKPTAINLPKGGADGKFQANLSYGSAVHRIYLSIGPTRAVLRILTTAGELSWMTPCLNRSREKVRLLWPTEH